MTALANNKAPIWYYGASGLALVFFSMMISTFTLLAATFLVNLSSMSAEAHDLYKTMNTIPVWYMMAPGFAGMAGVAGSLGLILRKKWAAKMLACSLIIITVQQIYLYSFSDIGGFGYDGQVGMFIGAFLPVVIIAMFVWLSHVAATKKWLK